MTDRTWVRVGTQIKHTISQPLYSGPQKKFSAKELWNMLGVPADTRRNNNVIMTSKRRRFDVMMTLLLRRVPVGIFWFCMGYLFVRHMPVSVNYTIGYSPAGINIKAIRGAHNMRKVAIRWWDMILWFASNWVAKLYILWTLRKWEWTLSDTLLRLTRHGPVRSDKWSSWGSMSYIRGFCT